MEHLSRLWWCRDRLFLLLIILQWASSPAQAMLSNMSSRDASRNITKILNDFFESGYDKRVRPNYGGLPVEVGISMFIISISTVSEVKMDFTSDFYFRQAWNDPRLSFEKQDMISNLFVGAEVAKKIWVPDTFFANEKQAYFHTATTPNRFLRISSDGDVFQSIRLTVTASCPMDLQYFPMDRQSCTIEVESYGYSMMDIRYTWSEGNRSVGLNGDLELPQFKVVGYKQEQKDVIMTTGNYSRLICNIHFARSLGFYLIQIYIPASLIVVISWVSFWLHRNATPARVALGVTTVLTMTTLMSSTNAQLPKISYIKSIDVFLGTCFVMVFGSLLEYAIVGYLGKRIAMRKSRMEQLSKLAEEHRKKCAAAAAAAAAAMEMGGQDTTGNSTNQNNQTGNSVNIQQQSQQPPASQQQLICATTGLPLEPTMQMVCGMKTPLHHGQPMNTLTQRSGSCHIAPNKMIYGCGQQYRLMESVGGHGSVGNAQNNPANKNQPNANNSGNKESALPPPFGPKDPNRMLGMSPSDIDKYSRVVFPVCFVCFNLMYWVIYMHISDVKISGLVPLKQ